MDLKSADVLTLQTLGALGVRDAQGEPVGAIAGQRRVLAFLSIVAAGGPAGVTRDRIAALLWPESSAERAGQSVTQALYSARRALDAEDLFLTSGELRLNPERITSDLQLFEGALAREDWPAAVAVYRGPFLDGFFLSGLGEFERWTSAQRLRYEDAYAAALRRVAEALDRDGEAVGALDAWKRLAAARPLDASVAVSLMEAMARRGDRAGAVRHAAVHSTLLREELDLDPDPTVLATADRLRRPVAWSQPRGARSQASDPALDGDVVATLALASTDDDAVAPAPSASRAMAPTLAAMPSPSAQRARRRRPRARILAIALTAAAAGLAYAYAAREKSPPTAPPPADAPASRIVVAPFGVRGASAGLAYLREGVVELLSERFAEDSASQSVDAGTVLSAWRRAGASNADLPRDSLLHLAATLGARRVVVGSVVGTPAHVILSASIVDAVTGRSGAPSSAEGPADSVSRLVDEVAAGLLTEEAGEDNTTVPRATRSLAALRDFLAGQAAFRRGAYESAWRAYASALARDSSFALAALQMVRSGDRLQAIGIRGEPLALAWRARPNLDPRQRALLDAIAGPRYPSPATDAEQIAAWQRLVAVSPDRAGAWYELGARLFHSGPVIGLTDARPRSVSALHRALSIDASYAPARRLLVLVAATDPSARVPVPSDAAIRDSVGPLAASEQWRIATARGDEATLAALRDTMPRLGPANLRVIAQMSQFDVVGLGDARQALDILRARPARPSERLEQAEALHSLAMLEGKLREVNASTERLRDLVPGTDAGRRLQVLDALYGDGDAERAAVAMRELAPAEADVAPASSRPSVRAADICVAGQWRAAHDDLAGAERDLKLLRAAAADAAPSGNAIGSLAIATPSAVCTVLLDATLAVARGGRPARDALAKLDSLALTPPVAGDASNYAPILIARLHARLGDVAGALAAVRRRVYLMGWPRYLATELREEARYAELLGDAARERSALERFIALREGADREVAPQRDAARQRLRALDGESPPS